MKISVCMAVYNGEKYIKVQLDSILGQLKESDELIIVDDCSKDKSVKIVEEFSDPKIKILKNDCNLGQQKTFEKALSYASGDIIFFSDQDDIWKPNKIEKMVTVILQERCWGVVCDATVIDSDENIIMDSFFTWRKSRAGFLKNFFQNTYMGCCFAIRSEVKNYVLPFPAGIVQHDEWIGLVSDFFGRIVFFPEQLVYYRRHEKNTSSPKRLPISRVIRNRILMGCILMSNLPKIAFKNYRTKA